MRYTYGTSDKAASRLEKIARFFNPLAAKFIGQYATKPLETAVDLGCGPGFTTDMLFNVLEDSKVYGLDRSDYFLKAAASRFGHCTFIRHDITKVPFPVRADLMYTRFLLSHLSSAVEMVNGWLGQLKDGGMIFIDEIEDIDTEIDVFRRYLEISDQLVASENAALFVGKTLAGGSYGADVVCNQCLAIPVTNSEAASWFYPNTITIWEKEPFVRKNTTATERELISSALLRLADSNDLGKDITWKMRRLVLAKNVASD
jgi:trans-aconitate 2-methyltransferase